MALCFVCAALAAIVWLALVYPHQKGPGRGREVQIVLSSAMTPQRLAWRLASDGIIADPRIFAAYLRLRRAEDRLRIGSIVLRDDLTPEEVAIRIARDLGQASDRITLHEGMNRFEIAALLDRHGVCTREALLEATEDRLLLLRLGIPGETAEGYLFPDTYDLALGSDAGSIVEKLVSNFRRRTGPLVDSHADSFRRLNDDLGFDLHDAVILASIVEKEAVVADEQPVIAGVFLNRLRSETFLPRQRLQADPTVSYGCIAEKERAASCREFDGRRITRAMLQDSDNRFNTYRHSRLPPGPISNPGLAALRGVLAPAAHDFFYFVAKGRGRHAFSSTLPEHNVGVAALREREDGP